MKRSIVERRQIIIAAFFFREICLTGRVDSGVFKSFSIFSSNHFQQMALKIRLQRKGAAHRPVYRMVVAESTARRDGRHVDVIGTYSPKARGQDPEFRINVEKYDEWYAKGARPSDTARTIINRVRRTQVASPVETAEIPVEATETTEA